LTTSYVNNGQTLFDLALNAYQDASGILKLIQENEGVLTDMLQDASGLTIQYTPELKTLKEAVSVKNPKDKVVTIADRQNIFDLSLQYYGKAEKALELVQANSFADLLEDAKGKTLIYTKSNDVVQNYYFKNSINIATGGIFVGSEFSYLLQENGFYILQENNDKILIE